MLVKTDRLVKTCSLRSNIINISQIFICLCGIFGFFMAAVRKSIARTVCTMQTNILHNLLIKIIYFASDKAIFS